ncbi:response regulator transcription factor [Chitinophaga filiformis]|uniref:DNA-binding response regulator, NarL/FixJ family, contains REC and HTH domains n=1 Tax=Chitinophaga filiformis TaxID=104663 RepID=A0A1G7X8X6_CHIFI|nr:response regulator transcription factor [Chitinophaga filiformis]SDG80020.1 DNA-binding response regulator, NarL/FixJ family, contains REC and HTH domains [Chitinophaga filiformis]
MKNVRRNSAGQTDEADALDAEGQGEAKQLIQQLAKDISNIVFMDMDIPGLTPTEAAGILKAAYPDMNIILFTAHGNEFSVANVHPRNISLSPPASLTNFFSQVYEAAMQTNILAVQKVLAFFNRKTSNGHEHRYGLSPRELEVLDCLVNGDTYKKIAEHCHISVGTVRSHIMNIYRKLDVNSRSGAIVKAMQERLVGS